MPACAWVHLYGGATRRAGGELAGAPIWRSRQVFFLFFPLPVGAGAPIWGSHSQEWETRSSRSQLDSDLQSNQQHTLCVSTAESLGTPGLGHNFHKPLQGRFLSPSTLTCPSTPYFELWFIINPLEIPPVHIGPPLVSTLSPTLYLCSTFLIFIWCSNQPVRACPYRAASQHYFIPNYYHPEPVHIGPPLDFILHWSCQYK